MAFDPTLQDLLDERIKAALDERRIQLEDLPMAQIQRQVERQLEPTADQFLLPHSVGMDSLARLPYGQAYNSGGANIVNAAPIEIPLGTVTNLDPSWSFNGTRFTLARTGLYAITATLQWGVTAAGVALYVAIALNGVVYKYSGGFGMAATAGAACRPHISDIAYLSAGSQISMVGYQASGGVLAAPASAESRLNIVQLSDYYST